MISEKDLDKAIDECLEGATGYTNCEKLATFLTIKGYLYGSDNRAEIRMAVDHYGDSEFLNAITGREPEAVWMVMDELMDALAVTNPRLYNATIRKITE